MSDQDYYMTLASCLEKNKYDGQHPYRTPYVYRGYVLCDCISNEIHYYPIGHYNANDDLVPTLWQGLMAIDALLEDDHV